jgi:nitroreductase
MRGKRCLSLGGSMKAEELRTIVEAATRAPSVHNTQPWRFGERRDPTGQIAGIDVFADRSRMLDVIDPEGRDLHLSCGAAIEFARIAIRSLGRACTVHLQTEPLRPDHVAFIDIAAAEPATDEELRLFAAVPARYTAREAFDETPVPDGLIERLKLIASTFGAWIRVVGQHDDEVTLAVLLSRSDDIERADDRYVAELTAWLHRPATAGDGIPEEAIPGLKPKERALSFRLRDMRSGSADEGVADEGGAAGGAEEPESVSDHRDSPPPAEHPLVCIIGTPGDDSYAWLQAGRALGRVLLEAAAEGVQASPMTQVTEVSPTRMMLAQGLGLVGHPQIVLRMGYAHGRPTTPRRPVDSVLD